VPCIMAMLSRLKLLQKPSLRLLSSVAPAKHAQESPIVSRPRTASDFARHHPITKISLLSNGIRVATEDTSGDSATVGVWIDAGSRYEDKNTNGVAHFLEHLTFKGTKNRSRVDLESEMENMGGHLNAYTSRESTVYYTKVLKNDVPKALDILSDMLIRSELSDESIEAERSVILRESKEIEKNLEETIFDHLHATAYRGFALGQTILGPKENILSIKRQDILNYIGTHYTANRIVIAASGAVDHDQVVKLAEQLFGSVPSTSQSKVYKEPAGFTGSDRVVDNQSWEKAHIAIAFPVGGWNDPDTYPLMVAQQLLGTWDRETSGGAGKHSASRMIRNLANDDVVQSVSTFNTQYSDTSLFGVYMVCHAVGQYRAVQEVCTAITELAHHVDDVQLETAKNQIKYHLLAALDGSTQIAEDIGRQLLCYGRRIHPAEQIARIDAVDVNAVKRVARRFFYDRDHALAAIGNVCELPKYIQRRRWSYWVRF